MFDSWAGDRMEGKKNTELGMSKEREYDGMPRIELLGIGSSKHRQLKANLQKALKELSLDIPIEEVTDIDELMRYEIAGIPALAVNGQVLFQQVVPSVEDLSIVLKVLLSGNVRMRQEDILVYCDTAIMFMDDAILIGNVVIEQGDSVKVFSDSTHYHADTKIADLYGNIALENGKQKLFTRQMRYDAGNKIAEYHTGAVMDNGKSQLKSKHGYYHVNEKMVFFKGDVVTTDPDFTMRTDTMTFNTETQTVNFVAPTLISQRDGKIYTEGGFYDIENNFAEFHLNP